MHLKEEFTPVVSLHYFYVNRKKKKENNKKEGIQRSFLGHGVKQLSNVRAFMNNI